MKKVFQCPFSSIWYVLRFSVLLGIVQLYKCNLSGKVHQELDTLQVSGGLWSFRYINFTQGHRGSIVSMPWEKAVNLMVGLLYKAFAAVDFSPTPFSPVFCHFLQKVSNFQETS